MFIVLYGPNIFIYLFMYIILVVGRDSSVGIANRYGLDGSGIEFLWGEKFRTRTDRSSGPPKPPIQWVPGLSRG